MHERPDEPIGIERTPLDASARNAEGAKVDDDIPRLAVAIKDIAKMVPFAVRTLRRMDTSGRLPLGFKVGGRKLWRLSDLQLWSEWGFPDRAEFEARMRNTVK